MLFSVQCKKKRYLGTFKLQTYFTPKLRWKRHMWPRLSRPHLSATQYGCRPSRNTFHAVFLYETWSRHRGTNLITTLLHWERAFDRIQHDSMVIVLQHCGVHNFIGVLTECYRNPRFFVEDDYGKFQSSGIRQRCPLHRVCFLCAWAPLIMALLGISRLECELHGWKDLTWTECILLTTHF